ncbi:GCN5-related N-acetyltransferase [Paenibacillus curdlanolyticus YK9]|uniref:GCN5-related N-acetyltransferase n=1 Tax=Paenibacillus curdlanolyticus YK9 TaxID=717606 RepID=E0IBX8_9BACL|nr:GNAT family N-acetyltransferase [Paenibacillus curdlanolyticus]EFM10208.1 GCN5-related N-acetyltransferase [Paenibacillus curdlanolyticus YK9]
MVQIKLAASEAELEDVYRIRKKVFVDEQGVSEQEEYDEHETTASHVLAYYEGTPAGTGRIRLLDGIAKLERICVLPEYRKYGVGAAITSALEQQGKQLGAAKAKLHGQTHAERFYAKLGYETVSDVFLEADIPHVIMTKKL